MIKKGFGRKVNSYDKRKKYLKDKIATKLLKSEECREYLISILSAALGLSKEEIRNNLELVDSKVSRNVKLKDNEVDIIFENAEGYFNVEINYCHGKEIGYKNKSYLCHLYLRSLKIGKNYHPKKIHQININNYDEYGEKEFLYTSMMMDKKYHKVRKGYDEVIIDINVDLLTEMNYNEIRNEKPDSLKRLLYVFINDNQEELDKIYWEDKVMKAVRNMLEELTEGYDDVLYYNKEELIRASQYSAGVEAGIEQGIARGIEQGIVQTAKKMLELNISNDIISQATGLTNEQIKKCNKKEL